jgi:hypothetical protein
VAHQVASVLATVRRSNVVCGFPAPRFHEGACCCAAMEGISFTSCTSPYSPYIGTAKHSDFLPSFPRRFVSFASRYRRCALGSLPRCKAQRPRAWDCLPDSQNRLSDGDDRTSQVPGGPHYVRAVLSDPGGTSALGHYCASALSSTNVTVSTPAICPISRLNPTARTLAVYASQGGLLHRHARLASGWPAILSGQS